MLSLNLIPPQQKTDIQTTAMLRHWRRGLVMLAVLTVVGTGGVITAWQLLAGHARQVQGELTALQQRQSTRGETDITATTGTLNTTIKILSTTLGRPQSWSRNAAMVLAALPSGTTVSDLMIQAGGRFRLVGVADSRQTFVALEQTLKTHPQLQQVTTSSTASKRTAVPFDFTGLVVAGGAP
ncbi:MAG: hypothetical protein AAB619_02800 [Patescibacteria group bacterium]